jgi:hypothetical protein
LKILSMSNRLMMNSSEGIFIVAVLLLSIILDILS